MKVVICEDNMHFSHKIEAYINNYKYIEDNSIQVVLNSPNPFEVLDFVQNNQVDCVFLDIDLASSLNGFDLAMAIRKQYPLASIIFVTTHSNMLVLTFKYKVEALDFIIKDTDEDFQEKIVAALKTAYEKYIRIGQQDLKQFFQLKVGEFLQNINFQDILYFKASDHAHKITLMTFNGQHDFYQSLNTIENYNERFFRCHKGYVINLDNIEEVNRKLRTIKMKNGETCPIAIRRLKALENSLSNIHSK